MNVKDDYGAVGDGVTHDTTAIQTSLTGPGTTSHSPVLYFPAGTYKITDTLILRMRQGVSLIGESPTNTTILWGGPGPDWNMHRLDGWAYSRTNRWTIDPWLKDVQPWLGLGYDQNQSGALHDSYRGLPRWR